MYRDPVCTVCGLCPPYEEPSSDEDDEPVAPLAFGRMFVDASDLRNLSIRHSANGPGNGGQVPKDARVIAKI